MDTIPEDGLRPKEIETGTVHPANKLDSLLYEVATEDFKDDPEVQKIVEQMSEEILAEAQKFRAWHLGQAEDYRYVGVDKKLLRPADVSPNYYEHSLETLGPELSEQVARAIAKRLGVSFDGKKSLEDFEGTDQWEVGSGWKWGSINIPMDGKGTVLNKEDCGLHYTGDSPLVHLSKKYFSDARPTARGVWSLTVHHPRGDFNRSLDLPLAPSKFSVPAASPR